MLRSSTRQWALFLVWLIALAAMLTAQYSSDFLGLPVCHLCWYQRICIYPLVVIIGIAAFRNDGNIALYTMPMTLCGAAFALFQYLEQMIPDFAPILVCTQGPSCSMVHMKLL
ncbi:MAG: disulfide bond formation protein B, partial [Coxiellaceae bacterium]|nr:disulfide bond formation protein B [Coxiellaceae bacterium]